MTPARVCCLPFNAVTDSFAHRSKFKHACNPSRQPSAHVYLHKFRELPAKAKSHCRNSRAARCNPLNCYLVKRKVVIVVVVVVLANINNCLSVHPFVRPSCRLCLTICLAWQTFGFPPDQHLIAWPFFSVLFFQSVQAPAPGPLVVVATVDLWRRCKLCMRQRWLSRSCCRANHWHG